MQPSFNMFTFRLCDHVFLKDLNILFLFEKMTNAEIALMIKS